MSDNKFNFSYSAPTEEERKEINDIKNRYTPLSETEQKLKRLRKLDATVKNYPTVWGLVLGVLSCLVFGLGLTCVLEWKLLTVGIIIAIVGGFGMAITYPVYKLVLNRYKNKYGKEILKLSDELLKN